MPRARTTTSRAAIAEYWLGTAQGRARLPDNEALIDAGEPACFACGVMAAHTDEEPTLWRVWNEARLTRCHLVPHALGGADAPSNLVLLCGPCHSDAPDVRDAEYMLRWIADREPSTTRLLREVEAAGRLAGVSEEMIEAFNERFALTGVESLRSLTAEWAVAVGGHFSHSTLAACVIEAVRRQATPHESGGR